MTGWGPKILVVCCPEAEATAREDGYEVADAPGQNRRRTQAWTWSSIARTNLCTTRTRPRRDLRLRVHRLLEHDGGGRGGGLDRPRGGRDPSAQFLVRDRSRHR